MNKLALDNSVAMRWCFKDGSDSDLKYAERVLESLVDSVFVVPQLWHLELINVLVRAEKRQWLTTQQSQIFLDLISQLPLHIDHETALQAIPNTLTLARNYHLSAYDAAYLELAWRYNIPLATLDVELRKAAAKLNVAIF